MHRARHALGSKEPLQRLVYRICHIECVLTFYMCVWQSLMKCAPLSWYHSLHNVVQGIVVMFGRDATHLWCAVEQDMCSSVLISRHLLISAAPSSSSPQTLRRDVVRTEWTGSAHVARHNTNTLTPSQDTIVVCTGREGMLVSAGRGSDRIYPSMTARDRIYPSPLCAFIFFCIQNNYLCTKLCIKNLWCYLLRMCERKRLQLYCRFKCITGCVVSNGSQIFWFGATWCALHVLACTSLHVLT